MHLEADKTFGHFVDKLSHSQDYSNDIIAFNVGNNPPYNYQLNFENDIQELNFTQKPIIFMSKWFHSESNDLQKYQNVVHVDWNKRFGQLNDFGILNDFKADRGHWCSPGVPDHAVFALNNLINLLTVIFKYL